MAMFQELTRFYHPKMLNLCRQSFVCFLIRLYSQGQCFQHLKVTELDCMNQLSSQPTSKYVALYLGGSNCCVETSYSAAALLMEQQRLRI